MHPGWARAIRDECVEAGVPFFFKQWGEWLPVEDSNAKPPTPIKYWAYGNKTWQDGMTVVDTQHMVKVGKHTAGRLLDGREWNEFPTVASVKEETQLALF
jgi:protein gp37